MTDRDTYPDTYREREIKQITSAAVSGESVLLIGLSGSGKSNLIKALVEKKPHKNIELLVVDCNLLASHDAASLLGEIRSSAGNFEKTENELAALIQTLEQRFIDNDKVISVVIDRFEIFQRTNSSLVFNQLRVLRDRFKYRLTYLLATRFPLEADNELAELFFGNTIWLGSLSRDDAIWNVHRYAKRKGVDWSEETVDFLVDVSEGYPSILRGLCEAYWTTGSLEIDKLISSNPVQSRLKEFWGDQPSQEILALSDLDKHKLLSKPQSETIETDNLTAKENALLQYLTSHAGSICSKDDLIQSIWTEDLVFEKGIRDDNLAQLVRRLRMKVEPDPSKPQLIQTVPGRGYRYSPLD